MAVLAHLQDKSKNQNQPSPAGETSTESTHSLSKLPVAVENNSKDNASIEIFSSPLMQVLCVQTFFLAMSLV